MNSILNAIILNQIQEHVFNINGLEFKLKGFDGSILIGGFSIPSSLNDEQTLAQLKEWHYTSAFKLLNTGYKKVNIDELTDDEIKHATNNEFEYWYLQITYRIPIPKQEQTIFKSQIHNIIFFITETDGLPVDFRIIYSKALFFDYVKDFSEAIYLDLDNLNNDEKVIVSLIQKIIYGACINLNISVPNDIDVSKFENLNVPSPELESFSSFLALTTRDGFAISAYKKDAKRLQKLFEKGYDEYKYSEKFRKILSEYFLKENDILIYDSFYNSDWKFDPEDLIAIVENITGQEFTFDYPEDTFSHELFPYVQKSLAKLDLELMNVDCYGDNYFFFIANKNEVDTIIELSQVVNIKIHKL